MSVTHVEFDKDKARATKQKQLLANVVVDTDWKWMVIVGRDAEGNTHFLSGGNIATDALIAELRTVVHILEHQLLRTTEFKDLLK